jgi:hypothetical protein
MPTDYSADGVTQVIRTNRGCVAQTTHVRVVVQSIAYEQLCA